MALFPAPSPSNPTVTIHTNIPGASGPLQVSAPIPTSGWFASQERAFFARGAEGIVRFRLHANGSVGGAGIGAGAGGAGAGRAGTGGAGGGMDGTYGEESAWSGKDYLNDI